MYATLDDMGSIKLWRRQASLYTEFRLNSEIHEELMIIYTDITILTILYIQCGPGNCVTRFRSTFSAYSNPRKHAGCGSCLWVAVCSNNLITQPWLMHTVYNMIVVSSLHVLFDFNLWQLLFCSNTTYAIKMI